MLIFSSIFLILGLIYLAIILRYIEGWQDLKLSELPENFFPKTSLTIIIPARNEAENILDCLQAINQQTYPTPLLQIIIVDDHSEDATPELVRNFPHPKVQLLHLADHVDASQIQSFKKKAIETAIRISTGELIVTTDADCTMDKTWLCRIAYLYEQQQPKFIAAPVVFHNEQSIFEKFQSLDFMGMMAVAGAGIHRRFMHMCNGANMAYPRAVFDEVGGFEGIDGIASGDDMLLLQKIARKHPRQIAFLKHPLASTITTAKPTLEGFVRQRVRWASKSGAYKEWRVQAILAAVWFYCVAMVLCLSLVTVWGWPMLAIFAIMFLLKGLADFFFLRMMARFFGREDLMSAFIPALFMHWWYIVIIGFLGNIKKQYEWKGRRVK